MNKDKNFKPMLAHKYDEARVDWSKSVYMQPKLDGVRCVFTKDGAYSRTGKKFMNLQHLFTPKMFSMFKQNPWLVLDGELYNHDLRDDFEKIISLVRKQKPTDEDRSEARKMIQYHVYDYAFCNPNEKNVESIIQSGTYKVRMNQLVCSDMYGKHVKYVPSKRVATPAMSKVIHQSFLDEGYEGSIMRLDGAYKNGRSYDLMKFKDFSDTEATIVDWVEGKGKRRGTIGKFIAIDSEGVKFGMPVMDEFKKLRRDFKLMQTWVGLIATFTYFERTKANSYRHPLFKAIRNYE